MPVMSLEIARHSTRFWPDPTWLKILWLSYERHNNIIFYTLPLEPLNLIYTTEMFSCVLNGTR